MRLFVYLLSIMLLKIDIKYSIFLTIIFGKCKIKYVLQMPNESEKKYMKKLPDSELEIMLIIWEYDRPVTRFEIESKLDEDRKLSPTTIL